MIKLQVTATPHATHRPPAPTNSRYTSYRKTTTPRSSQHTTNPQQINLRRKKKKKSVKRNRLSYLRSPSRAARTSPLIVVAQNTSML